MEDDADDIDLDAPIDPATNDTPAPDPNQPDAPVKPRKKPALHKYYVDDEDEDSNDEHDHEHDQAEQAEEHAGEGHVKKEELSQIIVHKKPPNLKSVLTYHEEIPRWEIRHFANGLDAAFAPCKIFMLALFRFPLQLTIHDDYSREFTYSWKSFRGWMFFLTGGLICLNAILISASLGAVMLDYPRQPDAGLNTTWLKRYNVPGNSRESTDTYELHKPQQELRIEELFLLQRNFVPMILLVLSLGHICTGDVSLFFRRTFIAKYFTFWEEAVEIMKMDAGKHPDNVHKYLIRVTSFYAGFLVVFIGLCAGRIAPVATGAPTQLVILWSRLFFPSIHAWKYLHILRWFGIVVYVYLLMCSKVYILLLLYICKILKNAYATWNERLVTVIHKGKKEEKKSRKEHCAARTGFDHLFRDYVVLLDLLRGADTMFANVIESYFGTQVFSLCFEVYYLLRTFSAHDEFAFARKLDGILITIYLFHSVIMLLLATNASAQVGEEAMEGLEIIRRNGCIGHKSIKEMYFTLSLYMSYTGHFETALTAGKFVTFDRSFMVSLVGTIFSYFIILTQFTPPLSMLDPNKLELINTKHLIINVESTYQINADMKVGYDTLSNITT